MREEARRLGAWAALALAGAGLVAAALGHRDREGRATGAATVAGSRAQQVAPAACDIVINEVETRGGSAGDWVELYNAGSTLADLSGYRLRDSDDSHAYYVLPSGTLLAAGGFLVLEQARFSFGLGASDGVRLYAPQGDLPVASYSWSAHAEVTQGRCLDGQGGFAATRSATKGGPNDCSRLSMTSAATGGAGEASLNRHATAALLPSAPKR